MNSKHYKALEYSLKYLNTTDRTVNILLKKEYPVILLVHLRIIVLKYLKGYEKKKKKKKNNNNNNNNNEDEGR